MIYVISRYGICSFDNCKDADTFLLDDLPPDCAAEIMFTIGHSFYIDWKYGS